MRSAASPRHLSLLPSHQAAPPSIRPNSVPPEKSVTELENKTLLLTGQPYGGNFAPPPDPFFALRVLVSIRFSEFIRGPPKRPAFSIGVGRYACHITRVDLSGFGFEFSTQDLERHAGALTHHQTIAKVKRAS
jgi:hypothetical protein